MLSIPNCNKHPLVPLRYIFGSLIPTRAPPFPPHNTLSTRTIFSVYECQLTNHLNSVEDQNRIVLYQADPTVTPWTRQCIRQADVILIIAVASENPDEYGPIEVRLLP